MSGLTSLAKVHEIDTTTRVKHLYADVEITNKAQMEMGGYVSTRNPDLAGDIVEPSGFKPHIQKYRDNPVYCWMHDQKQPIGKVNNVRLDDNGVYLEGIKLTKYPFVENFIYPLVLDGVLKQQSIGFLALKGKATDEGYFRITESYLLESSLVTVACNPNAVLDYVKAIDISLFNERDEFVLNTVQELSKAYDQGKIKLVGEMSKQFSVGNNPLAPDFADVKVKHVVGSFEEVEDNTVYVASSDTRKCNLFPVAFKSEDGSFEYSWEHTAAGLAKLLGARGKAMYSQEEKQAMLEAFRGIYNVLGKAFPTLPYKADGKTVDFDNINYHEIKWLNDESEIVGQMVFVDQIKSVSSYLKSAPKLTADIEAELKSFYAELIVYVGGDSVEDVAEIQQVVNALGEIAAAEEAEEEDYEETPEPAIMLSAEEQEALAKAAELLHNTARIVK